MVKNRTRVAWEWGGSEHWMVRDVIETMLLIGSQEEADDFKEQYLYICGKEIGRDNIGYFLFLISTSEHYEGGAEECARLAALFNIEPHDGVGKIHHTFGFSSVGIHPDHPRHPDREESDEEKVEIKAKKKVKP
jgi:hypothetical protein